MKNKTSKQSNANQKQATTVVFGESQPDPLQSGSGRPGQIFLCDTNGVARLVPCPDMIAYFMNNFRANVKRLVAAIDETVKEVERLHQKEGFESWNDFELSMIVAPVSGAAETVALTLEQIREHATSGTRKA